MLSSLGHCFHKVWLVAGIIQMGEIDSLAEVSVTEWVSSRAKLLHDTPWNHRVVHASTNSGYQVTFSPEYKAPILQQVSITTVWLHKTMH